MNITKDTNSLPLPLTFWLAGVEAQGVTLADITLQYHDGAGNVGTVSEDPPLQLQEISAGVFPGQYLLVEYPVELTAELGRLRVSWGAVPAVVDAGYAEFDVDATATYLRDLWLAGFGGTSEFDAADSSQLIYDELGMPYKRLPLQNKDGGDVVITSQGPVTRSAAIDP